MRRARAVRGAARAQPVLRRHRRRARLQLRLLATTVVCNIQKLPSFQMRYEDRQVFALFRYIYHKNPFLLRWVHFIRRVVVKRKRMNGKARATPVNGIIIGNL